MKHSDVFIHELYPKEVVEQRKRLIFPICFVLGRMEKKHGLVTINFTLTERLFHATPLTVLRVPIWILAASQLGLQEIEGGRRVI